VPVVQDRAVVPAAADAGVRGVPASEVEVAVVQERRLALKFLEVKSICRYCLTV
jgi:hypothetical protein